MKKGVNFILGVIVLFVFIVYHGVQRIYNGMVTMQESVTSQWGNVETQYQRRADLIPNFVNTVKGAAEFRTEHTYTGYRSQGKSTRLKSIRQI